MKRIGVAGVAHIHMPNFATRLKARPGVEVVAVWDPEPVRAEILNWLHCEEKDLKIPLSYTLLSNAVLLVEEGLGCAFCLDGALAIRSSPRLRFIPIQPERTTRSVLVWKKKRLFSPAAALFIQELGLLRAKVE